MLVPTVRGLSSSAGGLQAGLEKGESCSFIHPQLPSLQTGPSVLGPVKQTSGCLERGLNAITGPALTFTRFPRASSAPGTCNEHKHGTQYLRGLGELSTDGFLCTTFTTPPCHRPLTPPFQVPDCPVNSSPLSINQGGSGFLGEVK